MQNVYIISENGRLSKSNGTLLYTDRSGKNNTIFPHLTDSITAIGKMNITGDALSLLMAEKIPVFFTGRNGRYKGMLEFDEGKNVFLRHKQYLILDTENRIKLASAIVYGKLHNQYRFMQRFLKDDDLAIGRMKRILSLSKQSDDIEKLRGYEGIGAHLYFSHLSNHLPAWMGFYERRAHPALDPFNALLSFLYTLLSYRVETAIKACGLDPYVGVLHDLSYGRKSLVCDLMEEFRIPLCDMVACSIANRGQIRQEHFVADSEASMPVSMTNDAIAIILNAFESKLRNEVFYLDTEKRETYLSIINHQVMKFRKAVEEEGEYTPAYFR